METEQIRSFIAIELPDELKQELRQLLDGLRANSRANVKWVDPGSIHLTLKFLGYVSPEKIDGITAIMQETAAQTSSFRLQLKGLSVFPNLRRVQVVWVGITGDIETLASLQKRLESRLADIGFAPENREFTPHLTLGRVRNQASFIERQSLGELISRTSFEGNSIIEANAISLMRSQLTRQGAIYTRMFQAKLG